MLSFTIMFSNVLEWRWFLNGEIFCRADEISGWHSENSFAALMRLEGRLGNVSSRTRDDAQGSITFSNVMTAVVTALQKRSCKKILAAFDSWRSFTRVASLL